MSYLLDDKKILLKELLIQNEDIKRESENMQLENKAFSKLIENYEENIKFVKILPYIHYVCTSLYNVEEKICFNLSRHEFTSTMNHLLDESIGNYKHIFKSILTKSGEDTCLNEANDTFTEILPRQTSIRNEFTNGIYDINMDDMITSKCRNNITETLLHDEAKEESLPHCVEEDNTNTSDRKEQSPTLPCLMNEQNICLLWEREKASGEFYTIQSAKPHEDAHKTCLNLTEKQQLTMNEIEKIKGKIKKTTVHYENAKTIISSIISQCKILLFELDEETKNYKVLKETIKNDNYLMKRKNYLIEFYNDIIKKYKDKINQANKTNHTLLNLYRKKLSTINYIITISESINNVDFMYLHVLIHNKKLNYDGLMKEHEVNYACLRKILNEIRNMDDKITGNKKKEKEMHTLIEKNNFTLNELDKVIIDLTNKIDTSKNMSNKINQYEHVDILSSCSVLQCIQLSKDIHNIEKKIKSYERKIDIIENVKVKVKNKKKVQTRN
ncbi:hypothetical protein, conserved [Plasmodium gonderi]|uniref:Uncharacterized protein n=1 Tax=Plasmodium gonderi TaxID=77519 RepID=A0A1Y1JAX2_PLAGO|nr:hypothetical protein, conserved [Plasmodium gonderi]GAW79681.1 hypothetical protein, conserved [Plasmodium gonderi]